MAAILTPHPHVRDIQPEDLGRAALGEWLAPLHAELRGVDLSKPVFDSEGDIVASTRQDYISTLLAEKVWDFSERLTVIDAKLEGIRRQAALRVVRGEMKAVRSQAAQIAKTGFVAASKPERGGTDELARAV